VYVRPRVGRGGIEVLSLHTSTVFDRHVLLTAKRIRPPANFRRNETKPALGALAR
jgi:hypothetical protein